MPTRHPIIGDKDKPFHRPECECPACEQRYKAAEEWGRSVRRAEQVAFRTDELEAVYRRIGLGVR